MVVASMPELLQETDIEYMRQNLVLDKNDLNAEKVFVDEIEHALNNAFYSSMGSLACSVFLCFLSSSFAVV